MTFTLTTLDDAVAPGLIDDHRKLVEDIGRESTFQITLPIGNHRPRARRDFGQLPRTTVPPPPSVQPEEFPSVPTATFAPAPLARSESPRKARPPVPAEPLVAAADPEPEEVTAGAHPSAGPVTFTPPELDLEASARPRRRGGSRRGTGRKVDESVWPIVAMIIAGIAIFYVLVALLNH